MQHKLLQDFDAANRAQAKRFAQVKAAALAEAKAKLNVLYTAFHKRLLSMQENFYDIYSGSQYLESIETLEREFAEITQLAEECELDESQASLLKEIKNKLEILENHHPDGYEAMKKVVNTTVEQSAEFQVSLDEFEYFLRKSDTWTKYPKQATKTAKATTPSQDQAPVPSKMSEQDVEKEARLHKLLKKALRPSASQSNIDELNLFLMQHPEITNLDLSLIFENCSPLLRHPIVAWFMPAPTDMIDFYHQLRTIDRGLLEDTGIIDFVIELAESFLERCRQSRTLSIIYEALKYSMVIDYIGAVVLSLLLANAILAQFLNRLLGLVSSTQDVALEVSSKIVKILEQNTTLRSLNMGATFRNYMDQRSIDRLKSALKENRHLFSIDDFAQGQDLEDIKKYLKDNKIQKDVNDLLADFINFAQGAKQEQTAISKLPDEMVILIFIENFLPAESKPIAFSVFKKVLAELRTHKPDRVADISGDIQKEIDRLFNEEASMLTSSGDTLALICALERLKQLIALTQDSFGSRDLMDCRSYGDVIELWKTEKTANGDGDQIAVGELIGSGMGLFDRTKNTAKVIARIEDIYGGVQFVKS